MVATGRSGLNGKSSPTQRWGWSVTTIRIASILMVMSKVSGRRTCIEPGAAQWIPEEYMMLSTAIRILTTIAARSRCREIASIGWVALLLFLLPEPLRSQQSPSQELFHNHWPGCHCDDERRTAKPPRLARNQRLAGHSP